MSVYSINGKLQPAQITAELLTVPGVNIGDGLFETVAVYQGTPFALNKHLARLSRSCTALRMPQPDPDTLLNAIYTVLAAPAAAQLHTAAVSRLRITVLRHTSDTQPLFTVQYLAGSGPAWGQVNSELATVVTSEFLRNPHSALTGHKTTAYAENSYALRRAQTLGATEAVMFNTNGQLCEGTLSNLVVDMGSGELITPALSSGCLPGITRQIAFQAADKAGITLREAATNQLNKELTLHSRPPLALLGTLRNVQLVSHWDGYQLPASESLHALAAAFASYMPAAS